MKGKYLLLGLLLFSTLALSIAFVSNGEDALPIKKVLILHSDEEFIPANIDINSALVSKLKSSDKFAITIFSEYMDTGRSFNQELKDIYTETFLKRYAEIQPDIIIAIDFKAYTFLTTEAKSFYESTPVVFCMIPKRLIDESILPSNVAGNYMSIDAKGSIDVIMHMHPDTEEVIIVSGAGPASKSKLNEINDTLEGFNLDIKISYLQDKSMEETLGLLSRLPEGTIVLYNSIFEDAKGERFIPREALALMNNSSSVPIYGLYFTNLNYGLVGGSLFEFKEVANDAADKALKILSGVEPSSLPILEVQNKVYFNWALFDKWDIDESTLPDNIILLNKTFTTWELYKYQIIFTILFIIVETALIFFLILQLRLKKTAENNLNTLNSQLEKIVETRTESLNNSNLNLEHKNTQLKEEIAIRISIEEELKSALETLSDTQSQLINAEKQTAINHLIKNLLHRVNTPLGNILVYLDLLNKEFDENSESDLIVQKLTSNNKQLVQTMETLNTMLHIDSDEIYSEINLENYIPLLMYNSFLNDRSDILVICYPNQIINIQENNFKKVIISLSEFAKNQRTLKDDLGRAEIIFDLEDEELTILYKDHALDLITNVEKIFDPYTFSSYKATSSGLELVVLYNSVTTGLNGSIVLLENEDEKFNRVLRIQLPLPKYDAIHSI